MAHQITHPTGKPEGLSLAVLRLDAEPVAYLTPATGQFLSVDPLVQQTRQAYVYTSDDPVNGSDPSGLWPCTWKNNEGPPAQDGGSCGSTTVGGPLGGLWIESVSWARTPPGYTLTVNPTVSARILWWLNPSLSSTPLIVNSAWRRL
jgi:hypothetical protein